MRSRPFLLYLAGLAAFCAMDAVMKHLLESNPVLVVTFWRYVAATGFTLLAWHGAGRPEITREMLPIHLLRGAIMAASGFLFFWALTHMALAEAITLSFIAPLLLPPLASLILGERMRRESLVAGLVGFVGVLVAMGIGPSGSSVKPEAVAAVLLSALTYALSLVLLRLRASRDGVEVVGLLGAAIPALVQLPFMLAMFPAEHILLERPDWLWVVLSGLLSALALQLIAGAYAKVEAQRLAPLEYSTLAWAALLGWAFFAEPVALRTWFGAAIIAAACLWQARQPVLPAPRA